MTTEIGNTVITALNSDNVMCLGKLTGSGEYEYAYEFGVYQHKTTGKYYGLISAFGWYNDHSGGLRSTWYGMSDRDAQRALACTRDDWESPYMCVGAESVMQMIILGVER